MSTSKSNEERPESVIKDAIENTQNRTRTDEFLLLLDKYSAVESRLAKELEYGRLVRGKVKKIKTELAEVKKDHATAVELTRKQKIRLESLDKKIINLQNQVEMVRNTVSFRLGYALIHGFKSWSAFVNLPKTLLAIRRDSKRRRKGDLDTANSNKPLSQKALSENNQSVNTNHPHITSEEQPLRSESREIAEPALKTDQISNLDSSTEFVSDRSKSDDIVLEKINYDSEPHANTDKIDRENNASDLESLVENLKNLRMACIMDEFTYHSFKDECDLFQIRPDTWKAELAEKKPDILFLESAWKGIEEVWAKKISDISQEAIELIDYCKQNQIPVVFWNKEDPFHFGRFLPIAKRVDIVFTTDVDCIEKYKFEVGHGRVYLLPFAAQPASHNPIEYFDRKDAFSFAGSFYLRYPERQRDFDNIYDVGQELKSVDIYDRNFENPHPHLKFPEKYDASIVGCLPVEEIDKAYKGYKFGINMNTIKYSQTMFARRVYELMASNTIVVSNFSRGLRTLFGDLVVSSDARSELMERLKRLCEDEVYYRKFRLLGLRKVLSEHTYSHRLAFVLSKITRKNLALPDPSIAVVGFAATRGDMKILVNSFDQQNYPNKKLYIVTNLPVSGTEQQGLATVVTDASELMPALRRDGAQFVAPISKKDYYGINYLTDLALARLYATDFPVIGKAAYYNCAKKGALSLVNDGAQYHSVNSLSIRASLFRLSAFAAANIHSEEQLEKNVKGEFFSTDEFNYCRDADLLDLARILSMVSDIEIDNQGLDLENTVYRIVDTINPSSRGGLVDSAEKLPGISAKELYSYLPKKIANTLRFSLTNSKLVVKSSLQADQHKYIYLTKLFTRAELNFETNNRFQLLCDGEVAGDARTIYVFLDAKGEKIEHAMNKVGAAYSITIPKNCHMIKLGFRFQGPGEAAFERLILGDLREKPSVLLSSSENLVLTKQYPDYSDLYKYGFLHSRIKEYKKQNLDFEVFRVSEHVNIEYREFEGIDVLSSDYQFLDNLLQQGTVKKIIVHFIDSKIWNVLKKYLGKISIYIWIHGAEIQPWYRRAVRFDTASSLQKARIASDRAQEMWLDIFENVGEKLLLVFVSDYLANEVQSDFGCRLEKSSYSVIPNYVNNEFFPYIAKDSSSRAKILSIRPYASAIYGNDLSVEAVKELSQEPFFNELQFKFVGDGPLFESTLEPIKDFANVSLHKGFVTQSEIASLHKEYGLFLVPSRMDTQGVSRDEAMSSGLVPITNRVAAIPEFVDENCGILADPESPKELAEGIKKLYLNAELFSKMSKSASEKVRSISGFENTIRHEIELIKNGKTYHLKQDDKEADRTNINIAIYGDVNLNLTDGSAIWAVSLAETLAGIKGVYVTLFLKSRIKSVHIIAPLLNLSGKVRLVEPRIADNANLTTLEALIAIEQEDAHYGFSAVILRGMDLCDNATKFPYLKNKIWTYITDLPQQKNLFKADQLAVINRIFDYSNRVLCQTEQFKRYVEELFPQTVGRTAILSPMIPDPKAGKQGHLKFRNEQPLKIIYAGKFAPLWGIREMFEVFERLYAFDKNVEFHIFGDKIHNPPDDPAFKKFVADRLKNGAGIVWHKAVARETVMSSLPEMHIGWAFRHKELEQNTRELSTKILEYASAGVPVILSRNEINEEVFGKQYPLFADTVDEAVQLLMQYSRDKSQIEKLVDDVLTVSQKFTFTEARRNFLRQGVITYGAKSHG
ncbi:glycosyltransferase [Advenella sp. S44]|uniref:glycosyltransferase n=1 Tax=Advenella sp. S44 TaxID=1982755 RepID=UPI0013747732|nr:glycosyltransferase [Advenella sp. S44]